MTWEKVKFDEVIDINPSISMKKGEAYPFVEMANVGIRERSPQKIAIKEYDGGTRFEKGDTVIAGIEPCMQNGKKFYCLNITKGFGSTEFLVFRPHSDELLDSKFLYYFMQTWYIRGNMIHSMNGGTGRQRVNEDVFRGFEIEIPEIQVQKRIADILSAYDDLIENHQRQIRLLEEATQRLYKEWFVKLRFPGYETTNIIDGVPVGWKKVPLQSLIHFEIGGGWGEETETKKFEYPAFVVRGTDLANLIHGKLTDLPLRYHSSSSLKDRVLRDGDIVFEVSGGSRTEGVARTALIRAGILDALSAPLICASFCKLIRFSDVIISQFMYDTFRYLRDSGKTEVFDKRSASSIVNYRWQDFLEQQYILMPTEAVLRQYNVLAETMYTQVIQLSKKISILKEARDRLLPRLMRGELKV